MEKAHKRAMERMDRAEERSARIEAQHDRDFKKAMERMDRHDRQLEVTGKLLRAGIVLVRGFSKDLRELKKSHAALAVSLRGGNGRRRPNGWEGREERQRKRSPRLRLALQRLAACSSPTDAR